jgi:DNA-binding NtrC family response regulator
VRELRNTLERALMLSDRSVIDARALAPFLGPVRATPDVAPAAPQAGASPLRDEMREAGSVPIVPYADALAAWERRFLTDALAACGGKVVEAAARLGIGRATLYKKLAALGIDR